jgi:catechol 2,3-dioxygenase-like lactoylglutathione lyase family enzyme
MQPRIHVITLAVDDLDRAVAFYRDGLGLQTPGVIGTEFVGDDTNPSGAVAMFQLRGGLILALYPRTELAKDATIPLGPRGSGEFSIGHAVADKAAVDALLARPKRPAPRRSASPMSVPGASTPATSATPTATCGRSSGTPPSTSGGAERASRMRSCSSS